MEGSDNEGNVEKSISRKLRGKSGVFLFFGIVLGVGVLLQDLVWYADEPSLFLKLLAVVGILGAVQFLIVELIYNFLIIWKMWGSIQDGLARTTPGKAVGFLFIPFFNIYWIFQVWGGFPTDYNNFVDRHKLPAPKLPSGVYTAYPVITLLTVIPIAGILAAFANMFVFVRIISRTCDAVNALANSIAEQRIQMTPTPASRSAVPAFESRT